MYFKIHNQNTKYFFTIRVFEYDNIDNIIRKWLEVQNDREPPNGSILFFIFILLFLVNW